MILNLVLLNKKLFVLLRAIDYLACWRSLRFLLDPVHQLWSVLLGRNGSSLLPLLLLILRNYLNISDFLLLSKATCQHDVPR
jgi:hypothetical protein